jgi:hypothetical protein
MSAFGIFGYPAAAGPGEDTGSESDAEVLGPSSRRANGGGDDAELLTVLSEGIATAKKQCEEARDEAKHFKMQVSCWRGWSSSLCCRSMASNLSHSGLFYLATASLDSCKSHQGLCCAYRSGGYGNSTCQLTPWSPARRARKLRSSAHHSPRSGRFTPRPTRSPPDDCCRCVAPACTAGRDAQ